MKQLHITNIITFPSGAVALQTTSGKVYVIQRRDGQHSSVMCEDYQSLGQDREDHTVSVNELSHLNPGQNLVF